MSIKSIVDFVSRLSKRERTIFYATLVIVGAFFLDRLILSPILSKIETLNGTIRSQEEEIEQSLLIVTQEKRIEGESNLYIPFLTKPQTEEKEITAFLKEIEKLPQNKRKKIHVVGHSTGAILFANMLKTFSNHKITIESVSLLAPATPTRAVKALRCTSVGSVLRARPFFRVEPKSRCNRCSGSGRSLDTHAVTGQPVARCPLLR